MIVPDNNQYIYNPSSQFSQDASLFFLLPVSVCHFHSLPFSIFSVSPSEKLSAGNVNSIIFPADIPAYGPSEKQSAGTPILSHFRRIFQRLVPPKSSPPARQFYHISGGYSSVSLPSLPLRKSSSIRSAAFSVSSSFPRSRQCLLFAILSSTA